MLVAILIILIVCALGLAFVETEEGELPSQPVSRESGFDRLLSSLSDGSPEDADRARNDILSLGSGGAAPRVFARLDPSGPYPRPSPVAQVVLEELLVDMGPPGVLALSRLIGARDLVDPVVPTVARICAHVDARTLVGVAAGIPAPIIFGVALRYEVPELLEALSICAPAERDALACAVLLRRGHHPQAVAVFRSAYGEGADELFAPLGPAAGGTGCSDREADTSRRIAAPELSDRNVLRGGCEPGAFDIDEVCQVTGDPAQLAWFDSVRDGLSNPAIRERVCDVAFGDSMHCGAAICVLATVDPETAARAFGLKLRTEWPEACDRGWIRAAAMALGRAGGEVVLDSVRAGSWDAIRVAPYVLAWMDVRVLLMTLWRMRSTRFLPRLALLAAAVLPPLARDDDEEVLAGAIVLHGLLGGLGLERLPAGWADNIDLAGLTNWMLDMRGPASLAELPALPEPHLYRVVATLRALQERRLG